ncbi:unnamed protein product [Phaeothamnion confervicola]
MEERKGKGTRRAAAAAAVVVAFSRKVSGVRMLMRGDALAGGAGPTRPATAGPVARPAAPVVPASAARTGRRASGRAVPPAMSDAPLSVAGIAVTVPSGPWGRATPGAAAGSSNGRRELVERTADGESYMYQVTLRKPLGLELAQDDDGVAVHAVWRGSNAEAAGVKRGDRVVATSATLGGQMWEKTTVDGVVSAITSRLILADDVTVRLQRSLAGHRSRAVPRERTVTRALEVTLKKPVGLVLRQARRRSGSGSGGGAAAGGSDTNASGGGVFIKEIKPGSSAALSGQLQVGDRVVAVSSSLGGTVHPTNSVEGIVSAVATRVDGLVTLKVERTLTESEAAATEAAAGAAVTARAAGAFSTGAAAAARGGGESATAAAATWAAAALATVVPVAAAGEPVLAGARTAAVAAMFTPAAAASVPSEPALRRGAAVSVFMSADPLNVGGAAPSGPVAAATAAAPAAAGAPAAAPREDAGLPLQSTAHRAAARNTVVPASAAFAMSRAPAAAAAAVSAAVAAATESALATTPVAATAVSVLPAAAAMAAAATAAAEEAEEQGPAARSARAVAMIRRFADVGSIDGVERVLEAAAAAGEPADACVTTAAMAAALRLGAPGRAVRMFDASRAAGVAPTLPLFTTLVKAHGMRGRRLGLPAAFAVLDDIRTSELEPDVVVYNTLLAACVRAGDLRRAERLFWGTMLAPPAESGAGAAVAAADVAAVKGAQLRGAALNGAAGPSGTAGAAADEVVAAAATADGAAAVLNGAMAVMGAGVSGGGLSDAVSWNVLINGYARAREVDKALRCFTQMAAAHVAPTRATYTAVMKALVSRGRVAAAVAVLDDMTAAAASAAAAAATTAAAAAASVDTTATIDLSDDGSSGKSSAAAAAMRAARVAAAIADDLVPDAQAYNTVVEGYLRSLDWRAAAALVHRMRDDAGVAPDLMTYSLLMDGYNRAGLPREALTAFREMRATGIVPNLHVYTSAVAACARRRDAYGALRLLEEMRRSGVRPSRLTVTAAMEACVNGGRPALAASLFEEMGRAGLVPDAVARTVLVKALYCSGDAASARAMLAEIEAAGRGRAPAPTYNVMVEAAAATGDYDGAAEYLRRLMERGYTPSGATSAAVAACTLGSSWLRPPAAGREEEVAAIAAADAEAAAAAAAAAAAHKLVAPTADAALELLSDSEALATAAATAAGADVEADDDGAAEERVRFLTAAAELLGPALGRRVPAILYEALLQEHVTAGRVAAARRLVAAAEAGRFARGRERQQRRQGQASAQGRRPAAAEPAVSAVTVLEQRLRAWDTRALTERGGLPGSMQEKMVRGQGGR